MICDAHVHFFSPTFFSTLAAQRQVATVDALRHLDWDDPVSPEALADRWAAELEAQGVSRAAIIASVPGDEASVAAAVAHHPARFVGYFMLDPTKDDAESRVVAALEQGLRGVCLFPAMQPGTPCTTRAWLASSRSSRPSVPPTRRIRRPRRQRGPVVFVHCGVLSVGARQKLGLPSPFDIRLRQSARPSRAGARRIRDCRSSFRTSAPGCCARR